MTLRISADVRWRTVDGEAVIVSQTAGEVFGLNDTGTRLLELIATGAPLPDVITQLADTFDAPRAEIEADAHAIIAELESAGVLVRT